MALSEALRKLYGSLYLGSPGGMEAWRERNPPRPHTPPPPLLESRVVPRTPLGTMAPILLSQGQEQLGLSEPSWLGFCDFAPLPFGERVGIWGGGGIFLDSVGVQQRYTGQALLCPFPQPPSALLGERDQEPPVCI